ncbi:hypothetical protein E2C01_051628 [Portunus trituberculatus]|uniref:G-protein coupled receptors family 1 profile domain-containing protein n=1 Tax=Portunus trituberculatus TaxID=210409 RepID=A0A5B7GJL7_PORTR|nr:hypothetical protein [Portunus trituberculatus]
MAWHGRAGQGRARQHGRAGHGRVARDFSPERVFLLQADDLADSRLKSPGLLADWWPGYPVWQGQRDAAVPMVIIVTLAAVVGLVGNLVVAGLLCCPGGGARRYSLTGLYLLHRAIADACVQVGQPLMVVTVVADKHPWACVFNPALMQLGMVASIVFLASLALDSLLATQPHRFPAHTRRSVLRAAVTVAWVAGVVLFTLTGLGIFRKGDMCLEAPLFLIHTHDGLFVCLLLVFLLPLAVLVASLTLVLLKKEPPSVGRASSDNSPRERIQRAAAEAGTGGRESAPAVTTTTTTAAAPAAAKTLTLPRSARLLASLTLVFAVTQLPYWTLRIHYARARELLPFPVHAVIYCLAVVGTALNPILGVWFRVELWQGVVARLPSHPAAAVPLHTV